jgi:DNA polymerase III sliding clamp (beta) subunit (PCNA family)
LFEVNFVDNKAEFFIIPAEDFPKVPQSEGDYLLEVGALDFADAIAKTAFAAGTDESRPVLTGVLLTAKEKILTLVGVDGFRLSKKEIKLASGLKGEEIKEIIPAKSLMEVEKLIHEVAEKDDKVLGLILEIDSCLIIISLTVSSNSKTSKKPALPEKPVLLHFSQPFGP